MDFATEALKMAGALTVVLLLLGGALVMVKRFMGDQGIVGGGPAIRLMGGLRLGPGKSVVLVELAGEVLVLGSTSKELTLLTRIEDAHRIELLRPSSGVTFPKFGRWFATELSKKQAAVREA